MSKILVTGVNGFVGKHLTRELSNRAFEIIGVGRDKNADPEVADSLSNYYSCDLTTPEDVSTINLIDIDAVISLAGLARIGDSFKNPAIYMDVNVKVLSVLGEKILADRISPRIIAVSTGAVYDSAQEMPLTEKSNLATEGAPYVLSKIQMEKTAQDLRERGLDCVIARPFNHTGPGQEPGFLLPDLFYKVLAAKETGNPIKVGNLDTRRDYTDVRDVARAYADLATSPWLEHNLYNICSQRSIAGKDILSWLMKAMDASVNAEREGSLFRPNDPLEIYGSYDRLQNDVGWQPAIPIDKTVQDFVESMRSANVVY